MQKKELCFIIQTKSGKYYKDVMQFSCGLRQSNYTKAYKQAQDTLQALKIQDSTCRLTCRYMPTFKPNTQVQLQLI